MKKGFTALKGGNWKEYKNTFRKEVKASEWAFDRIREAFQQVAQDKAEKVSIVQESRIRSTDYLRRIVAPFGGQEESQCLTCARIATVSLRKTREKYDCKQPNRLFVVQTGDSIGQAKVFKAHAALQGLCANLINALKLLANQQEDGDGLLQNIVKNLGKKSRKGLTDGLREFIKVDNERALDVGYLSRGTGTCQVRKPKVPEGCPEMS